MESPFQFVRRYWNPAAVLDALDIKAWPPSVDEVDGSFYDDGQVRPAREEPARTRGDAPSVAPQTRPAAATATANGFSRRPPSPARPWLSPRDAALRIQSAYRGHRERVGARRVAELEAEIDAVETRIMASLDQILGDGKERARVSEMVMDVVVRLDAVKGCCREYRKSVIRKAISLQEALDCLVGGDGAGGGSGGVAADPTNPRALGREANNAGIEGQVEARADHDDDQGNSSQDDADEGEEEEEERSGSSCCGGGVKEALVRVTAENTALRGLVRDLLERNEQQAVVMQQMTERVDYLERKLQRLGRKRRRSGRGSSEEGAAAPAPPQAEAAASFSSSSSSAGEGDHDHGEVCRGGDGQRTIDRRGGGCQQLQDDRRQR